MNFHFLSTVLRACMPGPTGACSQSALRGLSGPNRSATSVPAANQGSASWSSNSSTLCSFDTSTHNGIDTVLIDAGASTFDTDPNARGANPVARLATSPSAPPPESSLKKRPVAFARSTACLRLPRG